MKKKLTEEVKKILKQSRNRREEESRVKKVDGLRQGREGKGREGGCLMGDLPLLADRWRSWLEARLIKSPSVWMTSLCEQRGARRNKRSKRKEEIRRKTLKKENMKKKKKKKGKRCYEEF